MVAREVGLQNPTIVTSALIMSKNCYTSMTSISATGWILFILVSFSLWANRNRTNFGFSFSRIWTFGLFVTCNIMYLYVLILNSFELTRNLRRKDSTGLDKMEVLIEISNYKICDLIISKRRKRRKEKVIYSSIRPFCRTIYPPIRNLGKITNEVEI